MSFRKEKKYRTTSFELSKIKARLLSIGMYELHPLRVVNSIYFDSSSLSLFEDSEEGILPRKKIRLRWYNNNLVFQKESKISSFEGRFKIVEKTNNLKSEKDINKLFYLDQFYGQLTPYLKVSYQREYFQYQELRLTFDQHITYVNLKSKKKFKVFDPEAVMEVKAHINIDDQYIDNLIPYPISRFSKYARGILNFY